MDIDLYVKIDKINNDCQMIHIQPITKQHAPLQAYWYNVDYLIDHNLLHYYFNYNLTIVPSHEKYKLAYIQLKNYVHMLRSRFQIRWHFKDNDENWFKFMDTDHVLWDEIN